MKNGISRVVGCKGDGDNYLPVYSFFLLEDNFLFQLPSYFLISFWRYSQYSYFFKWWFIETRDLHVAGADFD